MCSVRSNSPTRGNALKHFKTAVILKRPKCVFLLSKLSKCVSQTKILQSNVLCKVSGTHVLCKVSLTIFSTRYHL